MNLHILKHSQRETWYEISERRRRRRSTWKWINSTWANASTTPRLQRAPPWIIQKSCSPASPKSAASTFARCWKLPNPDTKLSTRKHTHLAPASQTPDSASEPQHTLSICRPERMKFIACCRVFIDIRQNVGIHQRWENRGKSSSKTHSGRIQ